MVGLLNLQLPHPVDKSYRLARRLLYEVLNEQPPEDEKNLRFPTTPSQLEVVGVGKGKILSLHFLNQPFKGNLSRLEQLCALPENTMEEKNDKAKQLISELDNFKDDNTQLLPLTVVYEFSIADGLIQRVSRYTGDFTAKGWRWEAETRTFEKHGREMKLFLSLARNGYRRAQQCQEEIQTYLKEPSLSFSEIDFYHFYLSALTNIADKAVMKRFAEYVRS